MTMARYGCILVLMTCFFVAVSSGGPVNEMITETRPSWFDDTKPFNPGYFNYDYVFFSPSGWFNYPNHIMPIKVDASRFEPDSITMPLSLSISKEELFRSKSIVSMQKQSASSSLSSKGVKPTFF